MRAVRARPLRPLHAAASDLPVLDVTPDQAAFLRQGRAIVVPPRRADALRALRQERWIGDRDCSRSVLRAGRRGTGRHWRLCRRAALALNPPPNPPRVFRERLITRPALLLAHFAVISTAALNADLAGTVPWQGGSYRHRGR